MSQSLHHCLRSWPNKPLCCSHQWRSSAFFCKSQACHGAHKAAWRRNLRDFSFRFKWAENIGSTWINYEYSKGKKQPHTHRHREVARIARPKFSARIANQSWDGYHAVCFSLGFASITTNAASESHEYRVWSPGRWTAYNPQNTVRPQLSAKTDTAAVRCALVCYLWWEPKHIPDVHAGYSWGILRPCDDVSFGNLVTDCDRKKWMKVTIPWAHTVSDPPLPGHGPKVPCWT